MGDKQRVCGFANFCPQTRRSFASVPPREPRPVWQGSKPAGILLGLREHLSSLVRAKLGHGCLKIGEPEKWLLSSWRPPIIIPKERQNLSGKSHNQRSVIAEHGSSREVPATARARDRPAFSEQFANVMSDPCCQRGQNPPSMHQIELVFFCFGRGSGWWRSSPPKFTGTEERHLGGLAHTRYSQNQKEIEIPSHGSHTWLINFQALHGASRAPFRILKLGSASGIETVHPK